MDKFYFLGGFYPLSKLFLYLMEYHLMQDSLQLFIPYLMVNEGFLCLILENYFIGWICDRIVLIFF